jgi:hypothetical protein
MQEAQNRNRREPVAGRRGVEQKGVFLQLGAFRRAGGGEFSIHIYAS